MQTKTTSCRRTRYALHQPVSVESSPAPYKVVHGMSYTLEYSAWQSMIRRCYSPKNSSYPSYGGRGITVCDEWRNSFAAFFSHVGPRPSNKSSLDRIDVNRPYEPGNVRWADAKLQAGNRRSNRPVTINGVTKNLADWIKESGLSYPCLAGRLARGCPENLLLHRGRFSRHHGGIPHE